MTLISRHKYDLDIRKNKDFFLIYVNKCQYKHKLKKNS